MISGQPIRAGIVGASVNRGWGWRSHVPALLALPDYKLNAICTAHQETAEAAARETGAAHAFSDYHAMVQSPEVDLVTVAVRVPWHREMVLAAIEAGKHVYCEWPMGASIAEVEEMAAAARSAGVKAMVGLQGRSAPWVQHLKELVQQGYVGRPVTANAKFTTRHNYMRPGLSWAAKRANGNHLLAIQTAHMLDIVSSCLGGFREVAAYITTNQREWPAAEGNEPVIADAPDCVLVHAKCASGAVLSAYFAFVPAHGTGWRFEVFGDKGALVASSPGPAMTTPNRLQGGQLDDGEFQDLEVPSRLIRVPPGLESGTAFHVAHNYARLAEAIRGGADFEPSFDSGLQVYRLLAALERSDAEGGRWQTIDAAS